MHQKKQNFPRRKQFIMGKNSIELLLDSEPQRIVELYTSKEMSDPLLQKAVSKNITIKYVSKKELFNLVESESHQSYVALIRQKKIIELDDFLDEMEEKSSSMILLLDSIFDPQNLGTLLRAAVCFGADAVIWSKNRGTDVTPVVTKASVGATEIIPTIIVSNLVDTIKKCQKFGYESVAADVNPSAVPLTTFKFPSKTILIMGSEGKGIQPLILKNTDHKVYIPMSGMIDSLNVSQATSVFLYEWKKNCE